MFRVLQGFIDIAGQASRYARALAAQGVTAEAWFYERPLLDEPFDRILNFKREGLWGGRFRRIRYFAEIAARFSLLHIHKGFSLFHDGVDLKLFKRLNKRIIIHYRGSEIRREMDQLELEPQIIKKVKREAQWADIILVKDGQLAELIKPYVERCLVFPNIVDVKFLKPKDKVNSLRNRLRVVHIPSNPKRKGSEIIRARAEEVKEFIEYREMSNLPRLKVLEEYRDADIVIDQILTGTFGNTALEAMALGTPVIARLDPRFAEYEPALPPVINVDADCLAEVLRSLARDRSLLESYSKLGQQYVENYHSYQVVGRRLIDLYSMLDMKSK